MAEQPRDHAPQDHEPPGHALLESQVQAINRFPDQNPNPVLRVSDDGHLTYANEASEPVRRAFAAEVGDEVAPDLLARLRTAAATPGDRVEVLDGVRFFALLPVHVPELGFMNVYGTEITAEKVIERFPNQNPNPVFRVDDSGTLIYANSASEPLIEAFGLRLGDRWPMEIGHKVLAAADSESGELIELVAGVRTYALRPVRVAEFGFINVYGTDVTAEKVVAKFPGQNPNPVLRMDRQGTLIYANPASQPIVDSLTLRVGEPLPADLRRRLLGSLNSGQLVPIECPAGDLVFELLPVLIPEFDFVNIYGTDVTAAREVERLLLTILPPPIAARLRKGEKLIADRFEDATLLIADIAGFTQMSSELSAGDLVLLLDKVFRQMDELVVRHGLDKVKTIGDAYMVVGGVPVVSTDHVERVADMALDMVSALEGMQKDLLRPLSCRIGINSGPIVAGVIGEQRTIYDVWGDTVNVASRMESLGVPGRIQVTSTIYERLRDRYKFEERGLIEVKGKGMMPTYFLVGRSGRPAVELAS